MKLRSQILALGLSGALLAGFAGGIGLYTSSQLGASLSDTVKAGHALQTSQQADMMHDALRGDAQLALLGALEQNAELIESARAGLKDHAETYDTALNELSGHSLSDDSRAALAMVRPLVQKYTESVAQVVGLSATDAQAAQAAMPAVQTVFSELEDQMAAMSESIEKHSQQLETTANERVQQSAVWIGAALALAVALMTVASLSLARSMVLPIQHAVSVADSLAQGDLTVSISPSGNDEARHLLQSLAHMQASFASIVKEVKSNADEVASASAQIAGGNQDLSNRTEQQASALQETAATMDQLGSTVRNNADHARQANQLALGASSVAIKGGEVMGQVVTTMTGINDSSKKIAEIIGVIDGIAFQTNILALNAAVEAARAGEQGRGFAVVAGEVRNLAHRSAEAAREVKSLVNASVDRVEQGTALVGQAGHTMDEIVSAIKRVTDIVAEISAASAEQSAGIDQVGLAVSQMDQSTQRNTALIEESAAASETLKQQARQLVDAVAAFKTMRSDAPHANSALAFSS
jgi:methyl-accepting chemotaxis protein